MISKRQNKIVCLHVRDDTFAMILREESYRNSNIDKYLNDKFFIKKKILKFLE